MRRNRVVGIGSRLFVNGSFATQAHFRWGLGFKFRRTNWELFEPKRILEFEPQLYILVLQIMSFPLSFSLFLCFFSGFESIEFPFKMVRCRFSLDLPLFWVLDLSLHLGSPNHELFLLRSFLWFVGLNQWNFLRKWCNVGLALICHFFGLGPQLASWFSSNHELSFVCLSSLLLCLWV